jgi:adenylate cyclase, class 2
LGKEINIVEIKAKCTDAAHVKKYLMQHGAIFNGVDHQIDTYFKVPKGRLKLRDGNIENNLIFYNRNDTPGLKSSKVKLYKVNDTNLKDLLTAALEILVIVDKLREIYFIDNVKFHIDSVKGLGTFVEIEAIDRTGKIRTEVLREQCAKYLKDLKIKKASLISNSYSDLLLSYK